MNKKESKDQLLNRLIDIKKAIEEKVEIQDEFIEGFSTLVRNESLFCQVVENFPFPIAIFKRNGVIVMLNRVFTQKAGISSDELLQKDNSLCSRINEKNQPVMEAVKNLFEGETALIQGLVDPMSLFESKDFFLDNCKSYQCAVFFPVMSNSAILYGAVMLMK